MKDLSQANKPPRNSFYTKKRPSPLHRDSVNGAASKRKSPSAIAACAVAAALAPSNGVRKSSPYTLGQEQRQREAQRLALAKESRLLEEEYRADVRKYMHEMESCTMGSASSMDQQPEIRWHMRPCLVDFIVEVHLIFRLRPETLYLTLNIIDRYVSRRVVYVKHYQLVGCAALWIAAKFEDAKDRVPTVQDLYQICREAYDESAFIQMEGHVLATIQWMVGHPTAEAWLRLACIGGEDTKTQHIARFLMEITLFHREFITYPPSAIAAAALMLARFANGKPHRSQDETEAVLEIVQLLDAHLAEHINQLSDTLVKKYSYSFYSKASTFILQFYLSGRRFVLAPAPAPCLPAIPSLSIPPVTPVSGPRPPPLSFGSGTTSASDATEDMMPVTPGTPPPSSSSDPFAVLSNKPSRNFKTHHHRRSSSFSSSGASVSVTSSSSWRDKENVPVTVERPPQAHYAKIAASAAGGSSSGANASGSFGGFGGLSIGSASEDTAMYTSPAGLAYGNANGRSALHDFNGYAPSPILQPIVS